MKLARVNGCSRPCRRSSRWGAALVLLVFPLAAPAQDKSVHPGANQKYFDQELSVWKNVFEDASREIVVRRRDILGALDLQPGMTVADIGAGTGLFTFPFAKAVGPRGKVYAVDIVPKFVAHIKAQKKRRRADNVVVLLGKERDVPLPEESVDLLFLCDVYHHVEYPRDMNRSLFRVLRPGGALVVIDFKRVPGRTSKHILEHVRAGAEQVIQEIESSGFEKVAELPLLEQNYFIRFRKPPAPPEPGQGM